MRSPRALQKEPIGHGVQERAFVEAPKAPALQGTAALNPVALQYVPAGQSTHPVAPMTDEKVLTGHGVRIVEVLV